MAEKSIIQWKRPRLIMAAGTIGWLAIVVMSVLPGSARPHSGAGGVSEHFIAYAMVAFCLSWHRASWRYSALLLVALCLTSAVLELAQLYIPGRTSELKGVWSAMAGALAGLTLTMLLGYRRRAT